MQKEKEVSRRGFLGVAGKLAGATVAISTITRPTEAHVKELAEHGSLKSKVPLIGTTAEIDFVSEDSMILKPTDFNVDSSVPMWDLSKESVVLLLPDGTTFDAKLLWHKYVLPIETNKRFNIFNLSLTLSVSDKRYRKG